MTCVTLSERGFSETNISFLKKLWELEHLIRSLNNSILNYLLPQGFSTASKLGTPMKIDTQAIRVTMTDKNYHCREFSQNDKTSLQTHQVSHHFTSNSVTATRTSDRHLKDQIPSDPHEKFP